MFSLLCSYINMQRLIWTNSASTTAQLLGRKICFINKLFHSLVSSNSSLLIVYIVFDVFADEFTCHSSLKISNISLFIFHDIQLACMVHLCLVLPTRLLMKSCFMSWSSSGLFIKNSPPIIWAPMYSFPRIILTLPWHTVVHWRANNKNTQLPFLDLGQEREN